jgi:hypothetical protein
MIFEPAPAPPRNAVKLLGVIPGPLTLDRQVGLILRSGVRGMDRRYPDLLQEMTAGTAS